MLKTMNFKLLAVVTGILLSANAISCLSVQAASVTTDRDTVVRGDAVKISLTKKRKTKAKKGNAMKKGDAMKNGRCLMKR